MGSILYDLENGVILDAKLVPIRENERSLALEHLKALTGLESFKAGHREPVIFDRGYPSDEVIGQVEGYEINYVMRLPKRFSPVADRQEERDGWITLGKSGRRVRCIKTELSRGEKETLITNLGESEVEGEVFEELYHKRWKIETKCGMVKKQLELENFFGRPV